MIDASVCPLGHADEVEQLCRALGGLNFWNAIVAGVDDEIPNDIQIGIEVVLLRNHPNEGPNRASLSANVAAFNQEFTTTQRRATGNHAHCRGLARTVRSEQPKRLSAIYSEVDLINRALCPIDLGEGLSLHYRLRRGRDVRGWLNKTVICHRTPILSAQKT